MAKKFAPQPETIIAQFTVSPENKFVVKIVGEKCDIRDMYLEEGKDQFSFGKGVRFPKELGPAIALAILKGCKEELAEQDKTSDEIVKLLQAEVEVV